MIWRSKIQDQKAITLVETLVYLALFGLFMVTVLEYVVTITKQNQIAMTQNLIERSNIFVSEHLSASVKKSDSIDSLNSEYSTDIGSLTLLAGETSLIYTVENGVLYFNDSSQKTNLTPPEYEVTKFRIESFSSPRDSAQGFQIVFEIAPESNSLNSTSFETSFLID